MNIAPDPVDIQVLWQGVDEEGQNNAFRVQLELVSGQVHEGSLDLAALRTRLDALPDVWYSQNPAQYGRILFEALFADDLALHYRAAVRAAGRRGIRLRLSLDPRKAPELHLVRWERLYQPDESGWTPLAAAPNILFSRYLAAGQEVGLPIGQGPLRALIVVSSPFQRQNPLYVDAARERAAITDILDRFPEQIEYELLEGPVTLKALADKLDEGDGFDILHYVGHGQWEPDPPPGAAYLLLEKPTDSGVRVEGVSGEEVVQQLRLVRNLPRLIFLAACESAQQSTHDAFVGIGPRLVEAGCPAIVCMQEQVEVDVARQFARQFYAELLQAGVVDLAVNRARPAVFERSTWQWAVPVLFMNLLDGLLFFPKQAFPAPPRPYKFLASYTADDHDLFKGRSAEIEQVCERIWGQPVTVVYGEPGVGLTSLMEAGVRQALEAEGDLVVTLSEYADLAGEFRMQFRVDGRPQVVPAAGDAALPDVLRAVAVRPFRRLVLALDQFERALGLPVQAQQGLLAQLAAGQALLGGRLRLVLIVHSDRLAELASLRPAMQALANPWWELKRLGPDAAAEAIVEPLRLVQPRVRLEQAFARDPIVADLAGLYDQRNSAESAEDVIDPGHLQIVCNWLHQHALARNSDFPEIEAVLYRDQGGSAEGILARYMEEELDTHFADESQLARAVLVAMASPQVGDWALAQELPLPAAPPDRVAAILERLADRELLNARRDADGQTRYAFANHAVAQEARRLGGREIERRYQAEDELERIWRMWLALAVGPAEENAEPDRPLPADRALASPQQLRYLAQAGAHLKPATPKPLLALVKSLLLLRSAVRHDRPPSPWIDWLRPDEGEMSLVRCLEEGDGTAGSMATDYAGRLLGLHDLAEPRPPDSGAEFGDVAWCAASSSHPVTRRTCVLALATAYQHGLLDRLDLALDRWAQQTQAPRRRRAWRRAELTGVLLDADRSAAGLLVRRKWSDRAWTWLWRVQRRLVRDRRRLAGLTLGGAVGAGLGLGLLRGLAAPLAGFSAGLQFNMGLWWGGILGGALMAGLLLAETLLAGRIGTEGERPALRQLSPTAWLALLGALCFGLAHLFIALGAGSLSLAGKGLVILAGFATGLGLSLALADRPWSREKQPARRWLAQLGLAGLVSTLVQGLFYAFESELSIAVVARSTSYRFQLSGLNWQWWQALIERYPRWHEVFGLLDAALVGVVLCAGVVFGTQLARRFLAYWQGLVDRPQD